MYKVDPDKLHRELQKRNLEGKSVSLKLGYNKDYFAQVFNRGQISKVAAIALENLFDIRLEEYQATERTDMNTPAQLPSFPEIDYEKLGQVIYESVYQAVKKAWAE